MQHRTSNVEQRLTLNAPTPGPLRLAEDVADFTLAAPAEGSKVRKFTMTAYTGVSAKASAYFWPVVVDLAGMTVSNQRRPIFFGHDPSQIVGHSEAIDVSSKRVKVTGLVSGVGERAQEVVNLGDNGFPWQASLGLDTQQLEFVDRGQTVKVNGLSHSGPVYVIRKSVLKEISFVPLGADDNTSAQINSSNLSHPAMNFEQWLAARGFKKADLSAEQLGSLQLAYDAEQRPASPPPAPAPVNPPAPVQLNNPPANPANPAPPPSPVDPVVELRRQAATEVERQSSIRQLCLQYRVTHVTLPQAAGQPALENVNLEAHAIREGWTRDQVELAALRASRPQGPGIQMADTSAPTGLVMEAAVCRMGRLSNVDKQFPAATLEACDRHYRRGIGFHQILLSAAMANGYHGRLDSVRTDLEGVLRLAFSTSDLSGILSNIANKFLLQGFMAVEQTWRAISAIRPVNDFKQITSYRLTGDFEFEEVGPTGELHHGNTSEESYTNQARTYGKMHAIPRIMIVNDDLGALTVLPMRVGRGGALKLNKVFWAAFLDNASFFASGNNNYASGAGTALSIDALTAAELLFLNQTDADSTPLGIVPSILLVPNALLVKGSLYTRDLEVRDTTASTKYTTSNPHAGKWRCERSTYLSDATLSGYSALKYYLLADPNDLPVIETVFLNGVEQPTVESADVDFNQLGIQMRGYWDFGVAKQDERGGVAMKGEA